MLECFIKMVKNQMALVLRMEVRGATITLLVVQLMWTMERFILQLITLGKRLVIRLLVHPRPMQLLQI